MAVRPRQQAQLDHVFRKSMAGRPRSPWDSNQTILTTLRNVIAGECPGGKVGREVDFFTLKVSFVTAGK